MRIYISGKITDTDDYVERFAQVEQELASKGYDVINSAKVNAQLSECTTWEEYMAMSLCMLDMCDTIYMMNGWKDSKGACLEYGYALAKGKEIIKWY